MKKKTQLELLKEVIKAQEENAYRLMKYAEEAQKENPTEKNEQFLLKRRGEWLALSGIVTITEDKDHLERTAEIYSISRFKDEI